MRVFFILFIPLVLFSCEQPDKTLYSEDLPADASQLEDMLSQTTDQHLRLEVYWKLYKVYKKQDTDKSIYYLDLLETESENIEEHNYLGKVKREKGLQFKKEGNYDRAIDNYLKAIEYHTYNNYNDGIAANLNSIGNIFMKVGDFEYAIEFFLKVAKYDSLDDDITHKIITNFNLATCYVFKGVPDYRQANFFFHTSTYSECAK